MTHSWIVIYTIPENTKHLYRPNTGPTSATTSKTLVPTLYKCYTIFCVYWDVKIRLNEDKLKKRNGRKWETHVSNMSARSGSIWLMIDVSRDASVTIPVHAALVIFYLLGTEHSVTRTPTSTSHYVCNDQRFITVKNPVFTETYSVLQNQKAVIVYILSRRDCVLSLHDSFIHI